MQKRDAVSAVPAGTPLPGDHRFVGPQTEAEYREMEMSYLPASIEPHAREILHKTIESKLSSMAISLRVDISELDNAEMYDLRRRVFAPRIRNRRT